MVEFATRDGQVVPFPGGIGPMPPDYPLAATVDVVYDLDGVQHARVSIWNRLWLASALITTVACCPS